jgi:hypothetical protein
MAMLGLIYVVGLLRLGLFQGDSLFVHRRPVGKCYTLLRTALTLFRLGTFVGYRFLMVSHNELKDIKYDYQVLILFCPDQNTIVTLS